MFVSLAVVACGAADEPKQSDPPQVSAQEVQPKNTCVQLIQCKDGLEYCCLLHTCVVASCELPQWNRNTCSCQ